MNPSFYNKELGECFLCIHKLPAGSILTILGAAAILVVVAVVVLRAYSRDKNGLPLS